MLAAEVQIKVTGPNGAIRKCALTAQSWLALEAELKQLHGISGPVLIQYIDEDEDLIILDSDGELATMVKWLVQTKATSVKMVIKPAIHAMLPDQYNSTNSMASYRTQDSFSGVIPAPDGSLNGSSDSWRFKGDDINSINSQNAGSSAYNGGRLSQAMEYTSTASYTSENGTEHHRRESDVSSGARAAAREAAYKAAIEANNAARRAFEESKAASKAQREAIKMARRAGAGVSPLAASGDSLPAYSNEEVDK